MASQVSALEQACEELCARELRVEQAMKALLACGGNDALAGNDALRFRAWSALLGCGEEEKEEDAAACARIAAVPLDLPNQRVVQADAARTRPDQPALFRAPEAQARVVRLLTHFCASTRVPYRQGLNELLAPFLMLRPHAPAPATAAASAPAAATALAPATAPTPATAPASALAPAPAPAPPSDAAVAAAFARLVARFTPRIFAAATDGDFTSLQCSLRLLSLLLQYHEPALHAFLDQFGCAPELYATPWLLTLFARSLPRGPLLVLWDLLLASARRPGPVVMHCLVVAFLASHRDAILATRTRGAVAADLPIVMSRLAFDGEAHVRRVFARALELMRETPMSFLRLIHNVCYSGGAGDEGAEGGGGGGAAAMRVSPALLARLERRMCVKISIEELLVGTGSRFAVAPASAAARAAAAQRQRRVQPAGAPATAAPADSAATAAAAGATAAAASSPAPPAAGLSQLLAEDSSWDIPPRYFLLDVRSREEFLYGGHLPTAFHLDEGLLHDPEALDAVMRDFARLKGVHFAVLGAGDIAQWYHSPVSPTGARMSDRDEAPDAAGAAAGSAAGSAAGGAAAASFETERSSGLDPLSAEEEDDYGATDCSRAFVALFLQRGFTRVSEVEGGFAALHQHQAHFLGETLVAHEREYCMVCSGGTAAALYAGRNALERGHLLQDVTPFRRTGAAGAAGGAAATAAAAAAAAARIVASRGSGGGGGAATARPLPRESSLGSLSEAAASASASGGSGASGGGGSRASPTPVAAAAAAAVSWAAGALTPPPATIPRVVMVAAAAAPPAPLPTMRDEGALLDLQLDALEVEAAGAAARRRGR